MTTKHNKKLHGYFLLKRSRSEIYRGVDRDPFRPVLTDNEIVTPQEITVGQKRTVWEFYPPSWKQDAYRLYEENTVEGTQDNLLYLISNYRAAAEIKRIIEPQLGHYEIVESQVWSLETSSQQLAELQNDAGYDIAYPGGDFYSAILNGIFVNPHPSLLVFKKWVNGFGLFYAPESIREYTNAFRENVPSERNSEFSVFQLQFE